MTTAESPAAAALADRLRDVDPAVVAAWIQTLPPGQLAVAEQLTAQITGEGWRSSPAAMALELAPESFTAFRYSLLLSERFVDAVEGRRKRQIWNLPARYGKSLVGSRFGPAWAFDRTNGKIRIALASYGTELARENAIFVRDFLRDHGNLLTAQLKRDRRRQDRFVTDQGGGVIAAGIGSALTGFGAHGIVIDDPFKDWQEAHSEAARKRVWDWYRAVARLRLETEDSWIILVMTRWHEEDLAGKMIEAELEGDGEHWDVLRLPALADSADDPLGRAIGEPLEPRRFSLEAVKTRASVLGPYLASGLEQQLPQPEEGTDIMRGWWKWHDVAPPRFDAALTSWDMKLKDKEAGDFVVGQAWGRVGSHYYLLDQLRGQYNFPTVKVAIALLYYRHPECSRHIIENTGNGPEVIKELRAGAGRDYTISPEIVGTLGITEEELPHVTRIMRRGMDSLIPNNPKGDKRARMRAETGKIESGHVHVPYGRVGELVVGEASAFPNGAHDDMVDAASQALKRLSSRSTVKSPKGRTSAPKPSARSIPRPQPGARSMPVPGRPQRRRRAR